MLLYVTVKHTQSRYTQVDCWGEGTNWILIDLNANILARNIYFLQIKESLTHSALIFDV